MDTAEKNALIECVLCFESGAEKYERVSTRLFEDSLELTGTGIHRTIRLNSLSGVSAENYRVILRSGEGDMLLSMIGHWYEDFSKKLVHAYNEVVFNESLMREDVHFEAEGEYVSPNGTITHAVFRVCETALVILPDTHTLCRIPFCMIARTEVQPYRFSVTDRFGRAYLLQKMGRITDPFLHAYDTRFRALLKQTRERLSEIAPADDKLAHLLMEGMIAREADIRAVSSVFANALDAKLAASTIAQEYGYLKTVSDDLAIGIKRGLMGDLTGESINLLVPVFDKNILIMESLAETAMATYIFHITQEPADSRRQWESFLLNFNYSMLSVNFRREPIYLSDKALLEAQYEEYRQALIRVPELSYLRSLFIGRATHSGFVSWKKAMDSYIE